MAAAAPPRYPAAALETYARALFAAAGLPPERAAITARYLLEADLMGHTTHGLQLAARYLHALVDGTMTAAGEPQTVADRGACVTWDGRRLPGVWLTVSAVDLACARVAEHGVVTVAIRRSHHIACLAAFLPRAIERGYMVLLTCSDPSEASVAPFGGLRAVFTPDPLAVGIPTGGEPILIDMSASITTNGFTGRRHAAGERLPGPWVMDAAGNVGDDPAALFAEPPGTILPIGGRAYGHKGYGLALMIEALTQGLAGHGRADAPDGWGASVFVQVLDPAAFAGADAFVRQTAHTAAACRDNPPAPGVEAVRLPGQAALARRRAALSDGVRLHPGIIDALAPWAERLGVTPPQAMPSGEAR